MYGFSSNEMLLNQILNQLVIGNQLRLIEILKKEGMIDDEKVKALLEAAARALSFEEKTSLKNEEATNHVK